MKLICGKCKKEMKDFGNYSECRSKECFKGWGHSIPHMTSALIGYQMSGTIIIKD